MSTGLSSARRVGNSMRWLSNSPGADDDLVARAGVARRGEPAAGVRVHVDFHVPRLLAAPRIRGAKGATSMRSQHGLPAARGSRPSSARCQPSAGRAAGVVGSGSGVAAVVEGDGLLRVRAPHQQPQRQGRERGATLHAAPRGVACISASTSASTRIGLVT